MTDKEFIHLVKKMRLKQKAYFLCPDHYLKNKLLKECKSLEKQVDQYFEPEIQF